jgi:hypothetical protein
MNQTANSLSFWDRFSKIVKTLFAAFGASFVVYFALASFPETKHLHREREHPTVTMR